MSSPALLSSEDSHSSQDTNTNDHAIDSRSRSSTPKPDCRPGTPDAPPYSPLTPTLSTSQLPDVPYLTELSPSSHRQSPRKPQTFPTATTQRPSVNSISQAPPPVPISEDTNPDVIAIRAALDVLQIQRKRALQDIGTLRTQKDVALANPQGFAERLARGEISAEKRVDELQPPELDEEVAGDGMEMSERQDDGEERHRFELLPQPQDIVRCPPVNWAKYHIAEGVLDALHDEQRRRPSGTGTGPDHEIMAPYRPFVDIKEQLSPTSHNTGHRKRSG